MDSVRKGKGKGESGNSTKKKNKKNKQKKNQGFVRASAPGCYVANSGNPPAWLFGCEEFDREDYGLQDGDEVPDLSIDPEEGVLTVINASSLGEKSYYISTECPCQDSSDSALSKGRFRTKDAREGACTTFILTVGPQMCMSVCRIGGSDLFSHVSNLTRHPEPDVQHPLATLDSFPLLGVDFECPVGTPVVSVGNGTVVDVRDSESCWGIWAENLFHWNSIMVKLDSGLFVEYVHIGSGSARVREGQSVEAGQVIAESGNIGFCPVPHLHIQCHLSQDADAQTVKFSLRDSQGKSYIPQCGQMYK